MKLALFTVAFVGFAVLVIEYNSDIRGQFIPRRFGVVEQGAVYRSGQISARLIDDVLDEHDIDVVISLSRDKPSQSFTVAEVEAARQAGATRVNYPLRGDGTGDITQYANALETIENARKAGDAVLVHCYAGTQRTGATIAFWRVLVQGTSPVHAYEEMKQYNHDSEDNPHLLPYMNQHMGTLAQILVDRGVIERMPESLPVMGPVGTITRVSTATPELSF